MHADRNLRSETNSSSGGIMTRLSLRARIHLIGAIIILMFVTVLYVLILPELKREKLAEREGKLWAVLSATTSVMDTYERGLRKQEQDRQPELPNSLAEAQARVLSLIQRVRYDRNEFFFILDGNGNVVMHPLKPELEGTNILDLSDPEGGLPFRELVLGSQRDGSAVVNHLWQSKYSEVIFEPQLTCATYYWPWDWVVCSSAYVQDIDEAANAVKLRTTIYMGLAAMTSMILLFLFSYFGLTRPLEQLLGGIRSIRQGDMQARVVETGQDELGFISRQFNAMVEDVAGSRLEIERSEKRYKDLTELLPDIIYETDLDLNLTYLNEAAFALTGFTRSDLAEGLPLARMIPEVDLEPLKKMIASNRIGTSSTTFTAHQITRKDGSILFGENNAVLINDSESVRGVRGVMRDVTDKIQMERSLIQSQKMETIGTLAGGIAHDFNNILAGIIGTISLMEFALEEEGQITHEQLGEDLGNLTTATNRAANMVKQILGLSRKHTLTMETVDLNDVLTSVVNICRSSFDKIIELDFQFYEAGRAMIEADITQLEQVLLNLCVNARDAMTIMRQDGDDQAGCLTVRLARLDRGSDLLSRVSAENESGYWCISVTDQGVGMDQETLKAAFDPFFTTKAIGQGTGLGLSMAYNILEQHGGHIDIDSVWHRGTTVSMILPAAKECLNPESKPVADLKLISGTGHILLIDDDSAVRIIGQRILEKAGYDVTTAADGVSGIDAFQDLHQTLDLVLLDLVMPKLSGRDVFELLHKINPQINVLMTSGFGQDERIQEVLDMGAAGFIQKPFDMVDLSHKVAGLLGKDDS